MSSYCCPVCETIAETSLQIGAIVICGHCGASLVAEPGEYQTRRANTADFAHLTPAELERLRKSRGRTR
jgi:ribosomal protein L37AE/L43A